MQQNNRLGGSTSQRYVVAVSGGVDSVVLLDMLVRGNLPNLPISRSQFPDPKLVVAHFDHGIRPESANDVEFVRGLAAKYELPFETKREELGENASEELARDRRYAFLRGVAKKYGAKIMTAHHADDIVETIAINLTRGTGWRGLAVLNSSDIERPLLSHTKKDLITYANEHDLEWREDATNQNVKYLRNELRQKLTAIEEPTREMLIRLRARQLFLRKEVDNESDRLVGASPYARHIFINAPESAALELLRAVFRRETGAVPTRPQLHRTLHSIKVLHAGRRYEVVTGTSLRFTKTHFVVEVTRRVVS